MIILVDQDGVLADFERGFFERWRAKFPDEFFIHPSERTGHFKIWDDYPLSLRENIKSILFAPGFIYNLPPILGAVEAIRKLVELGHDVMICTSPLSQYENCIIEKYRWVERYLGLDFTKRIILSHDKTLIRGHLLIDDKPEIKGIIVPEWEHIVFDRPYNRGVVGKRRINWTNWREVMGL